MNLLIIGGTGFFGKSILDLFKRGGLEKFGIDFITIMARNVEIFKISYPELILPSVSFITGDISKIDFLPDFDIIIHAAASSDLQNYLINPEVEKFNIEQGVSNFCKLMSRSTYNSKILYCSSGAVYGNQPLNIEKIDEEFPLTENLNDVSPNKLVYLNAKRFAEFEVRKLGFEMKKNVSIARCFSFSGKYLPRNLHFAYGNFIGLAENGETIKVNAEGLVYRSFMEADDMVESLFHIVLISNENCPIVNVGSDTQISLYDLALSISEKYGVNCEFSNFNESKIINRYVPNTDKLKNILNKSIKI